MVLRYFQAKDYTMTKVVFGLDFDYDVWNAWDMANGKSIAGHDWKKNLNKKVLELAEGKSFEDAKPSLHSFFRRRYKQRKKEMRQTLKWFQEAWRPIEKDYFKKLGDITEEKIGFKTCRASLATENRCPRNIDKKEYLIYWLDSPWKANQTSAHEILHFQFYDIWNKRYKGALNKNKTWGLSEAMTVLLNEEFLGDVLLVRDKGYPRHQELREEILKLWRKREYFDSFMKQAIKKTERML